VIAHDPQIRMRDIAALLEITERATQRSGSSPNS
jgi:hypothetical protein